MLGDSKLVGFAGTVDAAQARAFYEGTLGLRLVADEGFALVFDAGGNTLRIQKVREVQSPSYTCLGWQVDDIEATVRGLSARGVVFERYEGMAQDEFGIWDAGGGKVAWFKDPDGNLLSVSGEWRR